MYHLQLGLPPINYEVLALISCSVWILFYTANRPSRSGSFFAPPLFGVSKLKHQKAVESHLIQCCFLAEKNPPQMVFL